MTRSLRELADEYVGHMVSRNFSETTVKNVKCSLNRFMDFMEKLGVVEPGRLKNDNLRMWMKHLMERRTGKGLPLNVSTVNNGYGYVRKFLVFLAKRGHAHPSLPETVELMKAPRFLPKGILPYAKMKRMLAMIDTTTAEGQRNRTAVELLFSTGIRASELTGLNVDDVDFKSGTLRVMGKGRKERMVPIGRTALRFLESYVKATRQLFLKGEERRALFLSERGGRISYDALLHLVKRNCGVDGMKVACHTFRRSFATELVKGNANIWHVKTMMGHSSLKSLNAYVSLNVSDLRKTLEKCHPRENE